MPMFKKQLIILLFLAAAAAAAVFYTGHAADESVELDPAPSGGMQNTNAAGSDEKIVVYVTGAVNNPGVVELPAGARVIDAVNKCGGMNESADPENINLAQKLTDAVQIKIPEKNMRADSDKAPASPAGKPADSPSGKININAADETELDKLPGVGPAMAKRIIEYRQSEGQFQSIDDLKKVRGIGDAKFTALKDKITI